MSFLHYKNLTPLSPTGEERLNIPKGIWIQCPSCQQILLEKKLNDNQKVCFECGHHFRMTSEERICLLLDEGSFEEHDADLTSSDPLKFHDKSSSYKEKLQKTIKKTGHFEALRYGLGRISTIPVVLSVLDFNWMGGSMNTTVGEKFVRAVRLALKTRHPLISVSASGGARLHEGLFSLMQMARTSEALAQLDSAGLLYISILTDPTTGGVAASFATLGDVNIAEPGATIGFAGKRVIEQTIRQKVPSHFQTAEFCLEHGLIDAVVPRHQLKTYLTSILRHLPVSKSVV